MNLPPIRHLEAYYDEDGRVARLTLRLLVHGSDVAYIATIELNDHSSYPTEIAVTRRQFVGPTLLDVEEVRIGPHGSKHDEGFKTEHEGWQAIERLVAEDWREFGRSLGVGS